MEAVSRSDMKMALLILFTLFLLGALSGLAWKRIKGRARKVDLVAKSNHKSVWSFHYGPPPVIPVQEPAAAAPPLAPDNPLSLLLPEADFRAKEEKATAEEAARVEAAPAAGREATPGALPAADELGPAAEPEALDPAPLLASSRHASGATVNVFDVLALVGNDAPVPASSEGPKSTPPESASVDAALEAAPDAAPQSVPATLTLDDEPVGEAIYDNPVSPTTAAPTKNDAANTQASVTLRQRNRAALQARLDAQKTAMSAFTTDNKKPR